MRCFELRTRGDAVELNLEPLVRGYLTLCRDGAVEARSCFTHRRLRTYIIFYSKERRCDEVSEALLNAFLPEGVRYCETECERIVPFHGS